MKNLLLTLLAVFLFATLATAQQQGDISVGGGLILGTETALDDDGSEALGLGITLGGEYMATDVIGVALSYDHYFESSVDVGILGEWTFQISYLNIDGRYYFVTGDTKVYGLVGIGIGLASFDSGFGEASDTDTGLNLGGGATFPLTDVLGLNVQAKFQTVDSNLALSGGVVYKF